MRIDVVLTADAVTDEALDGATALVVDVLRASTSIIAALGNGAEGIVPVADADAARRRAAILGGRVVLAGERRGERIEGFDLGNSPLDFTPARVRGRTVIMTTSNGTRALLASRGAETVGIAALVNVSAAAAWAEAASRDVVVVCAGERGRVSLEDQVCAGLLVGRIAARAERARLTDAAAAAAGIAVPYGKDAARLARDSRWGRHLSRAGYAADLAACLSLDTSPLVPVYLRDVDKVVLRPR
jgi:2-phosphosulfolactate phosphatase